MQRRRLIHGASLLFWLFFSLEVWARAGGGGGGHGGGGHSSSGYSGSGGDGGSGLFLIYEFCVFLVHHPLVAAFLIVGIYIYSRFFRQEVVGREIEPRDSQRGMILLPEVKTPMSPEQVEILKNKVKAAFLIVQESWSLQTTSPMRRFISDGVYQRFNAQFKMMQILDQKNYLTNVRVEDLRIVKFGLDADYEWIDMIVVAEADDQFVSSKYSQFNSPGGREKFSEVWTFLRRRNCLQKADLFHTDNCPACGAPLTEKLLESARCPYCSASVNSGEFDWVLSDIIQTEFYGQSLYVPHLGEGYDPHSAPKKVVADQAQRVRAREPHFAIHILEDRAINAFLQILIGMAEKNIARVERFSTPEFFSQLKVKMGANSFVYSRLFVQAYELTNLTLLENNRISARVMIAYAFQRVNLSEEGALAVDQDVRERRATMTLIHEFSDHESKGSLYSNTCPHCGATQKETLNLKCDYCASALNDLKGDWIVSDLTLPRED